MFYELSTCVTWLQFLLRGCRSADVNTYLRAAGATGESPRQPIPVHSAPRMTETAGKNVHTRAVCSCETWAEVFLFFFFSVKTKKESGA